MTRKTQPIYLFIFEIQMVCLFATADRKGQIDGERKFNIINYYFYS